MGAPGLDHEARREVLDALAVLAGFETSAAFPRVRPDVHRRRRSDGAWFVGEAKATERSDDANVAERLEAYRDACTSSGAPALFVLSVPLDSAVGWARTLAGVLGTDDVPKSAVVGHSALAWTWYSAAEGHRLWRGQSWHFGLSGRHSSRPCWRPLTW